MTAHNLDYLCKPANIVLSPDRNWHIGGAALDPALLLSPLQHDRADTLFPGFATAFYEFIQTLQS